jgi:hypothetical protein
VSDCLQLEPVASSVRSARLFVVDKLQEWRCDDLVDRAALLTSELATNAVVHTGRPYSVRVERRGPRVRVEVEDATPDLPEPRELTDPASLAAAEVDGPPLEAEDIDLCFSGLGIVDRTASAWGSEPRDGGKVVWFEVGSEAETVESRNGPPSGLRDLRDAEEGSPLRGDLDASVDDWVVALDRSRLPAWARVAFAVLLLALVVLVALIVAG